ncbi:hypothetical protein [Mycobacteroides abscessus]|uniref:hypothetical protein n=1 Tax=Mycobacteroides abscessus TaxID=36809 RepID=UPI00104DA798|nr:hypothetical protein [Mycobacteroides abscessus]
MRIRIAAINKIFENDPWIPGAATFAGQQYDQERDRHQLEAEALDLVRVVINNEQPPEPGQTIRPRSVSSALVYLMLFDELRMVKADMQYNEAEPYHSNEALDQALQLIDQSGLTSFMELIHESRLTHSVEIYTVSTETANFPPRYLALRGAWHDSLTPSVLECMSLVLFEHPGVWFYRTNDLSKFERKLAANPGLQLSGDEIDNISWALTGADRLLSPDHSLTRTSPIAWSSAARAMHSSTWRPDSRGAQLIEARRRIAALCEFLTDNQTAAAIRTGNQLLEQANAAVSAQTEKRKGPGTASPG